MNLKPEKGGLLSNMLAILLLGAAIFGSNLGAMHCYGGTQKNIREDRNPALENYTGKCIDLVHTAMAAAIEAADKGDTITAEKRWTEAMTHHCKCHDAARKSNANACKVGLGITFFNGASVNCRYLSTAIKTKVNGQEVEMPPVMTFDECMAKARPGFH